MITKFSKPEHMTVDAAKAKFYTCAVLLTNCAVEHHAPVAGYVVAVETVRGVDYEELSDYEDELNENPASGAMFIIYYT